MLYSFAIFNKYLEVQNTKSDFFSNLIAVEILPKDDSFCEI